jgi:ssDNA-binding Zn-finger/Zn-ribbon topoisomerase 1
MKGTEYEESAPEVVPLMRRAVGTSDGDCRLFVARELEPNAGVWRDFFLVPRPEDAEILALTAAAAGGPGYGMPARLRPAIRVGGSDAPAEFAAPDLRPEALRPVLEAAADVARRIRDLRTAVDEAKLSDPPAALLAFAWTRGGRIDARISAKFDRGFGYDAGCVLAEGPDGERPDPVTHLTALAEAGYLTPEFHDLAHACPTCGSINVLMRDGCPACGAVDMTDDTLLHHFACGFQGEESRFATHGGAYVCPKCRRELRHFGLDYDKPGVLHVCNGCGHRATELEARGRCLACAARFSGEDSPRQTIHDFVLTPAGADALFSGTVQVDSVAGLIGRNLPLVPFDFAVMLAKRMAAIEDRHGLSTAVIVIDLTRLGGLPRGAGMEAAFYVRVGIELAALLRSTDAVAYHLGRLVVVLPGTGADRADHVRTRLCGALASVYEASTIAEMGFEHVTAEDFVKRPRLAEA